MKKTARVAKKERCGSIIHVSYSYFALALLSESDSCKQRYSQCSHIYLQTVFLSDNRATIIYTYRVELERETQTDMMLYRSDADSRSNSRSDGGKSTEPA